MKDDITKKEALFNEVKGSLFEFLVGKNIALKTIGELNYIDSIDKNYLTVLSQQDRMVRQFYPEMLPFLQDVSKISAEKLFNFIGEDVSSINLKGKLSNGLEIHDETDLLISTKEKSHKVSLKLNKQGAFVNTKSGGIKSFFSTYFPFLDKNIQMKFNEFVDVEFNRMALELHHQHDLDFNGNFDGWIAENLSELPGELDQDDRQILKAYYSRISKEMHSIITTAYLESQSDFSQALLPLIGFSSPEIIQLICFHDFKSNGKPEVEIHAANEMYPKLSNLKIREHQNTASVEIFFGESDLQIRVKPMNKFTTTAIKINCSVRL